MEEKDKKFVADWQFYHGRGKWLFILASGGMVGGVLHLLFSIAKFLVTETLDFEHFKHYFLSVNFLVEWLVYTLFIGLFVGYIIWNMSDKYYVELTKKEE
jgi:hypothetical protein